MSCITIKELMNMKTFTVDEYVRVLKKGRGEVIAYKKTGAEYTFHVDNYTLYVTLSILGKHEYEVLNCIEVFNAISRGKTFKMDIGLGMPITVQYPNLRDSW